MGAVVASPRTARARKWIKGESPHFRERERPDAVSGASNRLELPQPLGTGGVKDFGGSIAVGLGILRLGLRIATTTFEGIYSLYLRLRRLGLGSTAFGICGVDKSFVIVLLLF